MKKFKTVVITGATSGVGYEIAIRLHQAGHRVIATGRNELKLQQLKQQHIETIQADLTNRQSLQRLVEQLPYIDVAIINAGIGTFEYAHKIDDAAIQEMVRLNVETPAILVRELLPHIVNGGQLIFMGSQAGKVATPKASIYAATKHALIGYTNALRMELAHQKIAVSVIHPGPIDTPFLDHADATNGYRAAMANVLLSPADVAEATIRTIKTRKREINLPWYMGISSKMYAISPTFVEFIGKPLFNRK